MSEDSFEDAVSATPVVTMTSGQAGQTTHAEVEMLMECVIANEQAIADLDE